MWGWGWGWAVSAQGLRGDSAPFLEEDGSNRGPDKVWVGHAALELEV